MSAVFLLFNEMQECGYGTQNGFVMLLAIVRIRKVSFLGIAFEVDEFIFG